MNNANDTIEANPETRADILSATREYLAAYLTDQGFQCYDHEDRSMLLTAALDHWDTENPKTEFTFEELSASAKEHALQQYALPEEWWDSTYEYFLDEEADERKQGFNIEEINFSGFWSQGDGACWKGYVQLPEFIEHFYTDDSDVVIREAMLALIFEGCMEPRLTVTTRGRMYSHSGTMNIKDYAELHDIADEHERIPQTYAGVFAGAQVQQLIDMVTQDVIEDLDQRVTTEARSLADRIYKELEEAHDGYYEEATFAETADANGWKFDEDGDLL